MQLYGTDALDVVCVEVDAAGTLSIFEVRPLRDTPYPQDKHRLGEALPATLRLAL